MEFITNLGRGGDPRFGFRQRFTGFPALKHFGTLLIFLVDTKKIRWISPVVFGGEFVPVDLEIFLLFGDFVAGFREHFSFFLDF